MEAKIDFCAEDGVVENHKFYISPKVVTSDQR